MKKWFLLCSALLSFSLFADSVSFISKPMSADKASLAENAYSVSRLLDTANFSPELKLPVQLVYNSSIEKSGLYRGLYHVLGGRLSPINGMNGENLNLESLLRRTAEGSGVQEVILALSSDVEGRATMLYVAELLQKNPVKVSQPALGLPAGGNLSYADGATIRAALSGRHEVN